MRNNGLIFGGIFVWIYGFGGFGGGVVDVTVEPVWGWLGFASWGMSGMGYFFRVRGLEFGPGFYGAWIRVFESWQGGLVFPLVPVFRLLRSYVLVCLGGG